MTLRKVTPKRRVYRKPPRRRPVDDPEDVWLNPALPDKPRTAASLWAALRAAWQSWRQQERR